MAAGDAEPIPRGDVLAHNLITALTETNRLLSEIKDLLHYGTEQNKKLTSSVDDACAYMEVITTAADILDDIAGNGKSVTSKDIVKAVQAATREVFGDEEEEEEEEEIPDRR